MNYSDPIRPLKDVWLRPRRVFRALAAQPIAPVEYLLAAAQGVASCLIFSLQTPESRVVGLKALVFIPLVPVLGLLGVLLFTFIYSRLGARVGGSGKREEIFHIMAYSGVPQVASLLLWLLAFLLLGEAPWLHKPGSEVEGFVWIMTRIQFGISVALFAWSYLLQVMGLSEVLGLNVAKAFALWALGQMVAVMAVIVSATVLGVLISAVVAAGQT